MKKSLLRRLALLGLTASLLLACFVGCDKPEDPADDGRETTENNTTPDNGGNGGNAGNNGGNTPVGTADMNAIKAEINSMKVEDFEEIEIAPGVYTDYMKIIVKDYGEIVVRLREDIAPTTASGIKFLLGYNYYRGLTFHRVLKGSFIQGGCPNGDGTGGSGIELRGEFEENGIRNELSHIRGVISVHRDEGLNSASSQFFICTDDCTQFDESRAAFGYVVAGMEVVDAIANAEVQDNGKGENSSPVERIVMEKIVFVNPK